MIDAIFVIGKPGSGKTELVRHLNSFLTADGFAVSLLSDRLGLEEAVLLDTQAGYRDNTGAIVGPHSKLIADGPPGHRKVHVLDGVFLNEVHRSMVATVLEERSPQTVVLAEYAIGPDIEFESGKEPLLQAAPHLVAQLRDYGVLRQVLVIDTEAPLAIRAEREARRPDAMAPETFAAYFPDGGEMGTLDALVLGEHYHRLNNGGDDLGLFYAEAQQIYRDLVRPRISPEGAGRGFEGRRLPKERF